MLPNAMVCDLSIGNMNEPRCGHASPLQAKQMREVSNIMDKNPKHACWLLCTASAAYVPNGIVANDSIGLCGRVRIGKASKSSQRYGSTCRSKDGCSPNLRAIIFTSSVLSGAIRSDLFHERERAGTGWHDTTENHWV